MKASTLRLAFVLAIVGAVGIQIGRYRLAVRPSVVRARPGEPICTSDGGPALKLSWSAVPPGATCTKGGHVTWQPGLLKPEVIELADDSDCIPD